MEELFEAIREKFGDVEVVEEKVKKRAAWWSVIPKLPKGVLIHYGPIAGIVGLGWIGVQKPISTTQAVLLICLAVMIGLPNRFSFLLPRNGL